MEEIEPAGWCKFVRQVCVPSIRIKRRVSARCLFHHEKSYAKEAGENVEHIVGSLADAHIEA